jgi:hypothetical protein
LADEGDPLSSQDERDHHAKGRIELEDTSNAGQLLGVICSRRQRPLSTHLITGVDRSEQDVAYKQARPLRAAPICTQGLGEVVDLIVLDPSDEAGGCTHRYGAHDGDAKKTASLAGLDILAVENHHHDSRDEELDGLIGHVVDGSRAQIEATS